MPPGLPSVLLSIQSLPHKPSPSSALDLPLSIFCPHFSGPWKFYVVGWKQHVLSIMKPMKLFVTSGKFAIFCWPLPSSAWVSAHFLQEDLRLGVLILGKVVTLLQASNKTKHTVEIHYEEPVILKWLLCSQWGLGSFPWWNQMKTCFHIESCLWKSSLGSFQTTVFLNLLVLWRSWSVLSGLLCFSTKMTIGRIIKKERKILSHSTVVLGKHRKKDYY